jgi:SH3 domain-containing protein
MRIIQYLLLIIFLSALGGVTVVHAQETEQEAIYAPEDCNIDTAEIIEVVEEVCTGIGENQVCYGNFDVGADVLEDVLLDDDFDFNFENPGDLADLADIESLFLSALNPEEDIWGIAQMRLVTASASGAQELNLLLFGDVEITNAVEATLIVEVKVGIYSSNIRNLPSSSAFVLQSVTAGTLLEAVGRLEDNSWVRVRTETGAIGWVASALIDPVNEDESITDLEVQDDSSPYFGPMQAFYFEQGSASACGNVTSDGLLIQTPQGTARVNVSINGVNIELVPGQTGATALVQGGDLGMTISMVEGASYVEAGGTEYYLDPREATTIADGGEPTFPSIYDIGTISNLPTLSLVTTTDPLAPIADSDSTATNGDTGGGTTDEGGTTTDGGGTTTDEGGTTTDEGGGGGSNGECNASENANPNACKNK